MSDLNAVSGLYFVDLGIGNHDHMKICRRGQSIFWPLKCHIFFIRNLLDNSASFTSSRMKYLCQKWISRRLKQFDGLTWLTLTPVCYCWSVWTDVRLVDIAVQARWHVAQSACEEKKRKYAAMTSEYQRWQSSVDTVELRLRDVERRLNKSPARDLDTAAVRHWIWLRF